MGADGESEAFSIYDFRLTILNWDRLSIHSAMSSVGVVRRRSETPSVLAVLESIACDVDLEFIK